MESAAAQVPAAQEECDLWKTLVVRILQRDPAAEEDLVHHFYARVRVMAEIRLRGSEAAQDIAQEAMIAVLEAVRTRKTRMVHRIIGEIKKVTQKR